MEPPTQGQETMRPFRRLEPGTPCALMWTHAWALIPAVVYLVATAAYTTTLGPDLQPWPDAMEYALLATRLAKLEPPLLPIGFGEYPPHYSLSYPLALVPFAWLTGFNITHYYLASCFYGLLATLSLAGVVRWLTRSQLAGFMAGLFWALHPQTVLAANLNMSEHALVFGFCMMLLLARPLLEALHPDAGPNTRGPTALGSLVLGSLVGWLSVAKYPFVYWAMILGVLFVLFSMRRRRWRPTGFFAASFAVLMVAAALVRYWMYGDPFMTGYEYWQPDIYARLGRVFNVRYIFEPWSPHAPAGNLDYYGRLLTGLVPAFYGPPGFGVLVLGLLLSVVRAIRRRRIGWGGPALWGWGLVGVTFCLVYHYQERRFLHLWIPLADLVVAGTLARMWQWRSNDPARARWCMPTVRAVSIVAFALIVFGELTADPALEYPVDARQERPLAHVIQPMLDMVPLGGWVFTNYQAPLVEQYRAHAGPVGMIYCTERDVAINTLIHPILEHGLKPKLKRKRLMDLAEYVPEDWRDGAPPVIVVEGKKPWGIPLTERKRLFSQPTYALVVKLDYVPSATFMREVVRPLIEPALGYERVASHELASLYRFWRKPVPGEEEAASQSEAGAESAPTPAADEATSPSLSPEPDPQ